MPKAKFVARFDIAAYYTSMRHDVIKAQVAATALDAHHRKLIADYLALPDLQDTGVGMVASGGLSPLLGALYLTPLDRRMDRLCKGKRLVHYVRYMDDIVLLARTRWQLRSGRSQRCTKRSRRSVYTCTGSSALLGAPPKVSIFLATRSVRGRGFGLPPRGCVACVSVLASFMSERATGTAFGNTSCVGGVGTLAASTEWSAGKEASNAPGIMSVRISRGSIRPDECTVRGRLCEPA